MAHVDSARVSDVVLDAITMRQIVTETLIGNGATPEDAIIQADVLVEGDLRDQHSHGVRRLPVLVERLRNGLVVSGRQFETTWMTETVLRVDGHRAFGPVAANVAVDAVVERARTTGIAMAAIRNSNHIGMLAPYVEAIARATALPLVVYHRANAQFTPASLRALLGLPTVVGVKDGVGDVALMQRFVLLAREAGREILFFNGLLTAEMSQSAYAAIGVPRYSSAAFAMAPDIATAYFRADRDGDAATRDRLLAGFYAPLVALRDETPGFAVSLIKAGLRLQGEPVGSVRPPLVDPSPEQLDRLAALLDRGRELTA